MLAEADDLVEDALGYFPLCGFGDFDDLVAADDRHRVAVGIETDAFARDVVDYDGVEIFRDQFLAGILEDVLGFGGEAYDELCRFLERELFQNVGRGFEFEGHGAFALDFLARSSFRAIVRDSGGLDNDSRLRKKLKHGVAHFFGGLDSRQLGGSRRSQRGWATDQKDARTTA